MLELLVLLGKASCSSELSGLKATASSDACKLARSATNPTIFVKNLDFELTEKDLLCIFEQFGSVKKLSVPRSRTRTGNRGFAFVEYVDPRSAVLAQDNMQGVKIGRRILILEQFQGG